MIETEPIFERRGGELRRTGGMPPHPERYERVGIDVHRVIAGALVMGALVGLGVGIGLLLVWSAFVAAAPTRATRCVRRVARPTCWRGPGSGRCRSPASSSSAWSAAWSPRWSLQVVSGHAAGGRRLRADGCLPAGRGRLRPRPAPAARARRGVARGGRQPRPPPSGPGCRCPTRSPRSAARGPEPLRTAFDQFALDYQVTGRFGECLDRLKDRLADPVGDRVIEGLRIAREVGGGELGRLLRNLSTLPARRRPHPLRDGGAAGRGPSTAPGSRWRRRGWCCCSCPSSPR